MPAECLRIEQLAGEDGLLAAPVGIERRYSLLCGTVLPVAQPRLLQGVKVPVPREQERCPAAYLKVLRSYGYTSGPEVFDLRVQVLRIQRHPVAKHVYRTFAEYPGWEQMQRKLSLLVYDGVSGVAPALIPDHDIVRLGHKVDHPAFSLISPVDAYYRSVGHFPKSPLLLLLVMYMRLHGSIRQVRDVCPPVSR